MSRALVIVESPAKARTIARYLGKEFEVESSIGHVRDLPGTAAEIPAKYKKEPWARLGVNTESSFEPIYIVPPGKRPQVAKLKKKLAKVDELYLATDEDREGEAIAWHLLEVLKPKVPVRRMVFGEITENAIGDAVENTREIDRGLVSAQEARRVLDRLYGYEVSPVLWKKVRPKLSAGRVQSVATRLVVERERARMAFHGAEYWDLDATVETDSGQSFDSRLVRLKGRRVARGADFDDQTGRLRESAEVEVLDRQRAENLAEALRPQPFRVVSVKDKPFTRRPYPPFITSTLQQEAGRKLRFSAQRTMRVAQGLYENGYITYMRTDSVQLSAQAVEAARSQIAELYGAEFLPEKARTFRKKSKNAQEAHEAIRPAGREFRRPADLEGELDADAFRLYELIWKRTVACQMKNAEGTTTSVRLEAKSTGEDSPARFAASGKVIRFPGFLRAYVEGSDDPQAELEDQEKILPRVTEGETLTASRIEAAEHKTQPPARFTEASLVKELEERGIGRPSTYATILQTVQDRGYVWKKGSALVPTFTAFAVTRLMEQHLPALVDFDFTARMESDLDLIASGEREAEPWLHRFYFGVEAPANESKEGLKELIGSGFEEIDARAVCSIALGVDDEGREVAVRVGRYGPYLQAGDDKERASIRADIPPDELTLEMALELLEKAREGDRVVGRDPETNQPIYVKTGRFGDYVQLGDPELDDKGKVKKGKKPKMASLWPGMSRDEISLEDALLVLSFPRTVGVHPETGDEITAQDGRFGPYLKMGADSRSLEGHEALASVTLEQAVELFKQPKARGRARNATLASFGEHPESGAELSLKNGRFGPYVTDGVINASVPKGQDPSTLEIDQVLELLARREQKLRDQGKDPRAKAAKKPRSKKKSSKKKTRKKKNGKKATQKKATQKKASGRAASKSSTPDE